MAREPCPLRTALAVGGPAGPGLRDMPAKACPAHPICLRAPQATLQLPMSVLSGPAKGNSEASVSQGQRARSFSSASGLGIRALNVHRLVFLDTV